MSHQKFLEENKKIFTLLLVVLLVFLASLVVLVSVETSNKIKEGKYIGKPSSQLNTIRVSAKSEVYTKPDVAMISFSVVTEEKTASESMNKNAKKMNKIIEALKNEGVKDKDIKTTNFSIYPRYEWHKQVGVSYFPEGKRVLVGYETRQTIDVKIRNLDKIGEIIQTATNAGANQVGSLQFLVDNEEAFKKQAREEAIKKAKIKAKELAKELGVSLVRIVGFSENSSSPRFYPLAKSTLNVEDNSTPQIQTGQNKIEVNVTITYEIR